MAFAGGEFLHILGKSMPVPLPTFFTQFVPFLSNVRTPSRAIVFCYLFLAIIVSMIINKYVSIVGRRRGTIFMVAFSALVFLDYYPTGLESTEVNCPKAYEIVEQDSASGTFGILDLPMGYLEGNTYMMYQLCHEKPIVLGIVSRQLNLTLKDSLDIFDLKRQEKQLVDNRVKYIIIHKEFYKKTTDIYTVPISEYEKRYQLVYSDSVCSVMRIY
jgi:hypothetical protein